MENLERSRSLLAPEPDMPLSQVLQESFEPLDLRRPMKLFKGTLGIHPGSAAIPDPEFLVRLISGSPSHQALLRQAVGDQFKNLEHLLRGKHTASPTTLRILARSMCLSEDQLLAFAHGNKNGPLLPQLLMLFHNAERIPLGLISSLTATPAPCPCCGQNLMEDARAWWQRQALQLASPEYRFVDRLLNAVVGGHLAYELLMLLTQRSAVPFDVVSGLAKPKGHPIGNWLVLVKAARGFTYLWELAASRRDTIAKTDEMQSNRIKKWSSGQDLLPYEDAKMLTAGLSNEHHLLALHLAARFLAFATDFVCATADGADYPSRATAQRLVYERLCHLHAKARLALKLLQDPKVKLKPRVQ